MQTEILISISILFLFLYLIFLYDILRGLKRLNTEKETKVYQPYVSIIIPFRNETKNIIENAIGVIGQNYPKNKYEVLYVNDNSEDDSLSKLLALPKPENFKIINLKNYNTSGKKYAIVEGLKQSVGEIIVFSDADCKYNEKWLNSLVKSFEDTSIGLVAGSVQYLLKTNSVFQKLQQIEFASLIITGAGLIAINKPIICNAANLAFRRSSFFEANGLSEYLKFTSGDDVFLMQKISTLGTYKIKYVFDQDSIVYTYGCDNLIDFISQRSRWAGKSIYYPNKLMVLRLASIFMFYCLLILLPFFGTLWLIICLLLVKSFVEFIILRIGKTKLHLKFDMKFFPLAEILHIPYIVLSAILGTILPKKWKGRYFLK